LTPALGGGCNFSGDDRVEYRLPPEPAGRSTPAASPGVHHVDDIADALGTELRVAFAGRHRNSSTRAAPARSEVK